MNRETTKELVYSQTTLTFYISRSIVIVGNQYEKISPDNVSLTGEAVVLTLILHGRNTSDYTVTTPPL